MPSRERANGEAALVSLNRVIPVSHQGSSVPQFEPKSHVTSELHAPCQVSDIFWLKNWGKSQLRRSRNSNPCCLSKSCADAETRRSHGPGVKPQETMRQTQSGAPTARCHRTDQRLCVSMRRPEGPRKRYWGGAHPGLRSLLVHPGLSTNGAVGVGLHLILALLCRAGASIGGGGRPGEGRSRIRECVEIPTTTRANLCSVQNQSLAWEPLLEKSGLIPHW